MRGDLEKLAYESALRGLDKQERLLEELRARTSVLLAASSLAPSFLGQRAFEQPAPRGLVVIALLSFVVSVAASVVVLVPKSGLYFSMRGTAVEEGLREVAAHPAELHRRLAHDLDEYWISNGETISRLTRVYAVGAGALVVEVLSLAALVGSILV